MEGPMSVQSGIHLAKGEKISTAVGYRFGNTGRRGDGAEADLSGVFLSFQSNLRSAQRHAWPVQSTLWRKDAPRLAVKNPTRLQNLQLAIHWGKASRRQGGLTACFPAKWFQC